MKHIKKRFFFDYKKDELNLSEENADFFKFDGEHEKKLIGKKGTIAFLELEDNQFIGGIVNKIDGKNFIIPIPDPTLIYFHNAQTSLNLICDDRKELLKKLNFEGKIPETSLNEIYNYFGRTSGFVIFLFTAMESFINQMIPEDFKYENKLNRKTEVYNKAQIQENLDFKTKITKVLKAVTGKDFFQNSTPANQLIFRLKDFRDDIIHTKDYGEIMKYDKLIDNALRFPYSKSLDAVGKFMNFYKREYIIECDCGANF
jgi:hypothetical protein